MAAAHGVREGGEGAECRSCSACVFFSRTVLAHRIPLFPLLCLSPSFLSFFSPSLPYPPRRRRHTLGRHKTRWGQRTPPLQPREIPDPTTPERVVERRARGVCQAWWYWLRSDGAATTADGVGPALLEGADAAELEAGAKLGGRVGFIGRGRGERNRNHPRRRARGEHRLREVRTRFV